MMAAAAHAGLKLGALVMAKFSKLYYNVSFMRTARLSISLYFPF